MDKFEHQPDGAELPPSLITRQFIGMGINQNARLQWCFFRTVVIYHDDVDAESLEVSHLFERIGAAIQGDKKVGTTGLERAVDGAAGEPITVRHPPGHDETRIGPQASKNADQQRSAADPVDIVVTEHHDLLARGQRLSQTRRGATEILE